MMQTHPLAKSFWAKLVRFGQIWLDLSEIWSKLRQNLGKSNQVITVARERFLERGGGRKYKI